ncbi:polysaccharide deacetylase [Peptoniphilus sp. KCTC 25270]|uniref:polysaccharide deacetylase family protein n=1 Tax=Peptoniphilus sp. KCTC 25270 TaxID=2897414 RepID=UPI001E2D349B|nr:polysaccharide deacetylase family protein [Peptoniphilus sp. KCTC 25270]MCD1147248.1 polysaccharide deacetylase [Peptoniphilus sp. KCTC 25270]
MNPEEYSRERRQRRERIRKRKRRARIRGLLLLLIIAVAIVFGARKAASMIQGPFEGGTAIQWYAYKNMNMLDAVPEVKEDPANALNEVFRKNFDVQLTEGKNYANVAESYAYDTREIREYILGTKEYKGDKKLVFLTFDDGPNQTITPQILDVLNEEDVHATFFLVGSSISNRNRDVMLRQIREGNALALHSMSHDYSKMYPGRSGNAERIKWEAEQSQEALQEVISKDFHSSVWRYPGGHQSWQNLAASDNALHALDVEWIDWNVLTGDAEPRSRRPSNSEELISFFEKSISRADNQDVLVVLMHDAQNKQLTLDTLPDVIHWLKDEGYTFGILR